MGEIMFSHTLLRRIAATFVLVCSWQCWLADATQCWARQSKVKPATVVFQVAPQRLLESELAKSLAMRKNLERDFGAPVPRMLMQATLIRGIVTMPDSMDKVLQVEGENSPFDFYVEVEFDKQELLDEMTRRLAERSEFEIDQKSDVTIYRPKAENSNLYIAVGKTRTLTMATDSYDVDSDNLQNMSKAAQKLWEKKSGSAARLVIDVEGARKFIDELSKFVRNVMPEQASKYLGMIEQVRQVSASVDFDQDMLMKMVAEAQSSQAADSLEETLVEWVELAKASQNLGPAAEVLMKMLNSIRPKADGRTVSLSVAKPDGLEEAFASTQGVVEKTNNFKQAGLSLHNYQSTYGVFPFLAAEGKGDKLSWRVHVLPFLGEGELYKGFALDEPWDSPTNKRLLEFMPSVFGADDQADICWIESEVRNFADIVDGSSNTIAFLQNPNKVNWTQPSDLTADQALKLFLGLKPEEFLIAIRYDVSSMQIDSKMDVETFKAMLTPAGGEVADAGR